MGYNLPPGVENHMIPGNTPEDREWEELIEWLSNLGLTSDDIRKAVGNYILMQHELDRLKGE